MKPELGHKVLSDRGEGVVERLRGTTVTVKGIGWVEFYGYPSFENRWDKDKMRFDMRGIMDSIL